MEQPRVVHHHDQPVLGSDTDHLDEAIVGRAHALVGGRDRDADDSLVGRRSLDATRRVVARNIDTEKADPAFGVLGDRVEDLIVAQLHTQPIAHVANHGGNIKLWSRPGTGSTFTIELPIYREEKPAPDAGMKDNEKRDADDAAAPGLPRAVARVAARRKDKAQ